MCDSGGNAREYTDRCDYALHRSQLALVLPNMKFIFPPQFLLVCLLLLGLGNASAQTRAPEKVLRYAFEIAETGFDPAQLSDAYSRIATENIFDALYSYDYLARPAKVIPNVALGMPVISADFRSYTIKIKPGIYFADDPVFGGKKRELTAFDFAYSYKRIFDPNSGTSNSCDKGR